MEIARFGVGHRRPEGPEGSRNIQGQVIHSDGQGVISELAFGRNAAIQPHSNPNTTWFVVIEGGGFVQVGEEQARVAAGEAVLWPSGLVHGAWTEQVPMRAIVVEFAADPVLPRISDGRARLVGPGEPTAPDDRGEGRLRPRDRLRNRYDPAEGEPF
jgi:quercetin dioxygenase-like cupin family protein